MKKVKFKIGTSENTAQELKKSLELQLNYVSSLNSHLPADPAEAIHESRLSYKKSRALLRLIRDSMGYTSYYRENKNLRDMQRDLSRIRDADVQHKLLTGLSGRYSELKDQNWFNTILEKAHKNYELELNQFFETEKAAEISRKASLKAEQIRQYTLNGEGFEIIEGGLYRIYRQGREMGKMIFSGEADPYEIHAFRKKAKYLQYQISYLRTLYKSEFKAMASTMKQLTENLGYYNDLHLACNWIKDLTTENDPDRKNQELLLDRLMKEMHETLSACETIYENLYAEQPVQFTSRIRMYWDSHSKHLSAQS